VRSSLERLLDGQASHAVAAKPAAMVDGGQTGQTVPPVLAANVPGAQLAQLVPFK
jgi:hypothetical protein